MSAGRARIAMSPKEIAGFLAERDAMTVATLGPTGQPHLVAMWYVVVDGDVVCWTFSKGQKAVNIRRDPQIACLVEAGDDYASLRGVELTGTATVIEDFDEVRAIGVAIAERYQHRMPGFAPADIEAQARVRIGVVVHPRSFASWDHSKLG